MGIVELTKKLVEFETTTNKLDQVDKAIVFIKDFFIDTKLNIEEFEKEGKKSLMITTKKTKKPKFLMNGHFDVVDCEPDQFKPFEKDGKIFGRGTADMKAGVASSMIAMKHFADSDKDLGLMLVSDEELGGEHGTGYLVEQGYGGEFVIACEPNKAKELGALDITVSHKGVIWLKLTSKGKSCHASMLWLGENATEKLMTAYFEIKKDFEATTEDNRWKKTVNLGKFIAGDSLNKVPDKAEMFLDIRFTDKDDPRKIIDKIKQIEDIEVEVIEIGEMLHNEDNELITKLQEEAEKVTGKPCKLLHEHGSSDMRWTSAKKMPSIIFGPFGKNIHALEEFVDIESLKKHNKILINFIENNF